MSTEARPDAEVDPFRYGWRYLRRRQPNGRLGVDVIGLTLEDLLFPLECDQAAHTKQHSDICRYLVLVIKNQLRDVPKSLVIGNHRIDYDVEGIRPVGPDVAVFFEVHDRDRSATFDQARHHARPVLVAEVASPDTRKNDFGIKKTIYHRANVELYVIVDPRPENRRRPLSIHGFRRADAGYEPIETHPERGIWLEPLGLWLNHDADEAVFCLDGRTGRRIGDYMDQVRARELAEARAEAETARADAERERAEAHKARAEAEARARLDLEARLRAVEDEVRRLRGG